jgi:acyl CoA:acetate/3-ketoacid CoA transferase alpha subunit
VEVTVLTVPQCPNAALMDERLAAAAAGLPGVRVTRRVVGDEQQAVALGMRGSPTLLIGGADPFAAPGQPASLSCRLYRQADGSLAGAPPADALRRALAGAGQTGHD